MHKLQTDSPASCTVRVRQALIVVIIQSAACPGVMTNDLNMKPGEWIALPGQKHVLKGCHKTSCEMHMQIP